MKPYDATAPVPRALSRSRSSFSPPPKKFLIFARREDGEEEEGEGDEEEEVEAVLVVVVLVVVVVSGTFVGRRRAGAIVFEIPILLPSGVAFPRRRAALRAERAPACIWETTTKKKKEEKDFFFSEARLKF